MEEKATPPPPPLPLKVTPDEVPGRCTVMGPAAARVGEPCEAGLAMAGRRQKVSELTKKRRRLQRPMGFVHMFVQARKILKAAGTKKVSMEERNAPRNAWWIFAL